MIIIDGVSLAEKLEPVFRIGLSLLLGFTVYLMLKMINSMVRYNKILEEDPNYSSHTP